MNLEYKILWFEDEILWAKPIVRELKEYVEEMGFIFLEPRFEKDDTNIDNINYEEFDLILMDYNLKNKKKGDVLINKIREYNFFSEIVFYSMSGADTLRKAVLENKLDGVYCADRPIDSFLPKVQEVIRVTVKKVLDLNTIRGIVMAETSDIDKIMLDVITIYANSLEVMEKNTFLEKRRSKLLKSLNEKIEGIKSDNLDNFYNNLLFDSSQKWRTVLDIVKHRIPEKESLTRLYDPEIIQKRNRLAHIKEIKDTSGKIQLADGDFVLNEQTAKGLLHSIKKHEENIKAILEILKKK
jgi:DNA-binding NarL/FixJ family response regulator